MASSPRRSGKPARNAGLPAVNIDEDVATGEPLSQARETASSSSERPFTAAAPKPQDTSTMGTGNATAATPEPTPASDRGRLLMVLGAAGIALGLLALVIAATVPFWGNRLIVNDSQTSRTTSLALGQLERSIASGENFADELVLARSIVPTFGDALDQTLEELEPYAAGMPTVPVLRAKLDESANRIVASMITPDSSQRWLTWTANKIAAAIRMEPMTEKIVPDELSREMNTLRQIDIAVQTGQIERAIGLVDTLPPAMRPMLSGWKADAQRHLVIRTYMNALMPLAKVRAEEGPYFLWR